MHEECSCSQIDATLCKNAHMSRKNAGGGRQPLAKLCHCPAKAAWGVRDASARISAMLCKDLNSPQNGRGGKDFVSHPHLHWMLLSRQSPLRCKIASRESVHVHYSSSLVLSQKRQGKNVKPMIFWGRGLPKTFSFPKTP